jgi:hypothetical protein
MPIELDHGAITIDTSVFDAGPSAPWPRWRSARRSLRSGDRHRRCAALSSNRLAYVGGSNQSGERRMPGEGFLTV